MEAADISVAKPPIRPRRSRRVWVPLALAAWCLVSWIWWRDCALLLPFTKIPPSETRSTGLWFADAGEIVFLQREQLNDPRARPALLGPVEFWSLSTGQKTAERFTQFDSIECLGSRLLTVIRREGQRWVADLATGELLHRLPEAPDERRMCFPAGPGKVLYALKDQLVCFDYINQQLVWTREGLGYVWNCNDRYAIGMPLQQAARNTPQMNSPVLIDIATGVLLGLEQYHPCDFMKFSPDGRLALLGDRKGIFVLDIEHNSVIWRTSQFPRDLQFSDDSSELIQSIVDLQGKLQVGRIRIQDGKVLSPIDDGRPGSSVQKFMRAQITPDRRFALADRRSTFQSLWYQVQAEVSRFAKKLGWSYVVRNSNMQRVLIDVERGTVVGPISNQASPYEGPHLSAKGDGFVFRDYVPTPVTDAAGNVTITQKPTDWKIYHFPPPRNWRLLIQLWLAPFAAWALLACARTLWRRGNKSTPAAGNADL